MNRTARDEPERLRDRPSRPAMVGIQTVVITAAVALTILLAVVVVGRPNQVSLVPPGDEDPRPAASPMHKATPVPRPSPTVRFDPRSRQFLSDGIRGRLPAGGFVRKGSFDIGSPGVGGCFGNGCNPNLVGQHPLEDGIPWGAAFEAVPVEDALRGATIEQTADNILSYWRQYTIFYTDASDPVTVRNERKRTLTTNLPRPARIITAELHYHKPGLSVRYDHFYLLVVNGTIGNHTAFVAAWSDNAGPDIGKAIQDSIDSLEVV